MGQSPLGTPPKQTDAYGQTGRIIQGDACVAEGAAWLAQSDPRFAYALERTGPLPLRLKPDGFGQVLSAIVSQQVSVASANAIWVRLQKAGLNEATAITAASDEALRACGLSRQKMVYARALAEAGLDYEGLRSMPTPDVIKTLTQVKGIGVWTAEIYAMFSLGRADVFAPGDLALQESARVLFDLPERPTDRALRQMAVAWSPWQSVAARLLWAYYHIAKDREGIR
ncbi:DNA-3-methyladenine glycosylase family protein [Algirhabdus cladophorae]|uniref:DNA-3-methyladenine glycosylase family protein n=1 Tax=Algirhabdus cladophorae TaxID=3377108 RepID=UPI003B8454EA